MFTKLICLIFLCFIMVDSQPFLSRNFPPWNQIDNFISQGAYDDLSNIIHEIMNRNIGCEEKFFYIFCILNKVKKQKNAVQPPTLSFPDQNLQINLNQAVNQFSVLLKLDRDKRRPLQPKIPTRQQNLKMLYKTVCKLIQLLEKKKNEAELWKKLGFGGGLESGYVSQKIEKLKITIEILKQLINDGDISDGSKVVLKKKLKKAQEDKKKCEEWLKYLEKWFTERLIDPNEDKLKMLKELKKKLKQKLKELGVGDDFFKEEKEDGKKQEKQKGSEKEQEFYFMHSFQNHLQSYLQCHNIYAQPNPSSSGHVQVSLTSQQLQFYTSAVYGNPLQKSQPISLQVIDIHSNEWTNQYGVPPNELCCSGSSSFTETGKVLSISGSQITTDKGIVLRIKTCSQIHQLNGGTQNIYFRYQFSFQQQSIVQYALLWNNDIQQIVSVDSTFQQRNQVTNQFRNNQANPHVNQNGLCPKGWFHNGFFCQRICAEGLQFVNNQCVPAFNQGQG